MAADGCRCEGAGRRGADADGSGSATLTFRRRLPGGYLADAKPNAAPLKERCAGKTSAERALRHRVLRLRAGGALAATYTHLVRLRAIGRVPR